MAIHKVGGSLNKSVSYINWHFAEPPYTPPSYTPLVTEDFESGTLGNVYPSTKSYPTTSTARFSNVHSFAGTKSIEIMIDVNYVQSDPSFYGFSNLLPAAVPEGNTIWYAARFYFPTSCSVGYSNVSDPGPHVKFMRLSNSSTGGRIYLYKHREQFGVDFLSPSAVSLESENLHSLGTWTGANTVFPRDQWFHVCFAVKNSSSSDGFLRCWINDVYIGEVQGLTMPAATDINQWALGTHWNGSPYNDGSHDGYFYMDDVIIASDINGYGAPNTLDSGDRPYINSSTTVGDFA